MKRIFNLNISGWKTSSCNSVIQSQCQYDMSAHLTKNSRIFLCLGAALLVEGSSDGVSEHSFHLQVNIFATSKKKKSKRLQ